MMTPGFDAPVRPGAHATSRAGFTLLEIILVVALIVTVAGIAIPIYLRSLDAARIVRARADIKNMSTTIDVVYHQNGAYPASLAEVGFANVRDPWGRPYEYLELESQKGKGLGRKDKNLVPINSDYDLYSLGPDGQSVSPITAKVSRDDIIRANNGAFVGVAADY
jgi:general secretion pathway protein G